MPSIHNKLSSSSSCQAAQAASWARRLPTCQVLPVAQPPAPPAVPAAVAPPVVPPPAGARRGEAPPVEAPPVEAPSGGSTSGGSTTGGSTGGSTGGGRRSPSRVTLAVSCRGRVCTAHGKVIRPTGTQCNGRVIIAYVTGRKRLGIRSGKVGSRCTYRIRTRLHVSKRISRKQRSRAFAQVYFAGNSSLTSKLSGPVHVRVR